MSDVTRPAQRAPLVGEAEVVVVGGGPGGLGAALGAAQAGAQVLLVERYGFLGGMATAGGVNPFMPNHLDGRRLDSGAFATWCDALAALGGLLPDGRTFNPEVAKLAAEQICLEAGVELLYHASFDVPQMIGERIDALLFHSKSGPVAVRGAMLVDCTGDADLAARAGCPCEYGREADGLTQPMTANFDVAGVDTARMPNRGALNELYLAAKEAGRLRCPRENCLWFKAVEPGRIHFNTTRVVCHDATDVRSLSAAEMESRRQILDYLRWLRAEVPGFEECWLVSIGMHIGVRESRRVRGLAYLTRAEVEAYAKFADGICRCNYPIDIHNPLGAGTELVHFPPGEWYEIPYGCLVPQRVDNLLVGGRPISVDHAVHSSMRVMPPACTVGQAAGAAAALALRANCPPAALDGRAVKAELVRQGVWLVDGDAQRGAGGAMKDTSSAATRLTA
ncbi:MAG: FAD-dependent oxidoreductase [Fimbriimonadaceae bacterium]|nr:FAD-dependent oxidoreductase [Fimbriimonadaceae bacterium]